MFPALPMRMFGRIADQRGCAANVRRQNLGNEEGHRIDVQLARHHQGDGRDENDGRDVVEKRREHGGDEAERHRQVESVASRALRRDDSEILKGARLADQSRQHHHADEQEDHVEIDVLKGEVLIRDADHDHQHAARDGDRRLGHAIARNSGVREHENHDACDEERSAGVSVFGHGIRLMESGASSAAGGITPAGMP